MFLCLKITVAEHNTTI